MLRPPANTRSVEISKMEPTQPFENRTAMGTQQSSLSSSPSKGRLRRETMAPPATSTSTPRYKALYPKHHQCTHHIMTRLYTTEFHCSLCSEAGQFGWVYRCAQDRELLMDDEWERGFPTEKFDSLSDLFDSVRPTMRPRSPEARLEKYAFLNEINDEQLKTYSPAQIAQILEQRAHLQETVVADCANEFEAFAEAQKSSKSSIGRLGRSSSTPAIEKPWINETKPWMPISKSECQFKVCPRCRPSFRERAYLSIDAIVNGDLPATAVSGFGFNILKKRPVAPVELMKSIGLRPSPEPRFQRITEWQEHLVPPTPPDPAAFGLGISVNEQRPKSPVAMNLASLASIDSLIAQQGSAVQVPIPSIFGPTSPFADLCIRPKTPRLTHHSTSSSLQLAADTPLPMPTDEENEIMNEERALTPMEKDEFEEGRFGSRPLEVDGGVAVLEESVELHSADVITQY